MKQFTALLGGLLATVVFGLYAVEAATPSGFATIVPLPMLLRGGPSEALAINEAGTVVVGHGYDRNDVLWALRWTAQADGSWKLQVLPLPPSAVCAKAAGVANNGDAVGNDYPYSSMHATYWPFTGRVARLDCGQNLSPAFANAISADAQVVVGQANTQNSSDATVWRSDGCRSTLPVLSGSGYASARAVNGDGTIVGGSSKYPVRWVNNAGQWQVQQLDGRSGAVFGANNAGDLAGTVTVPCPEDPQGCPQAVVWYRAGGSLDLGTLGGSDSWARDINASGEVVGGSTSSIGNTAYFWSSSKGMVQLPISGRWAAANAISDVRADGTRVVVGMDSRATPLVWIVRDF